MENSDKIAARGALLDFYSNKCIAFGGFFIAIIFGLLTVLSLTQVINDKNQCLALFITGFSLLAYCIFGYVGYYVLKSFGHYAQIADKLEGGASDKDTGSLRDFAKLSEIKFNKGDGTKGNLLDFLEGAYNQRESSIGKKIISHEKRLFSSYIFLLIILGIVAYVPLIWKILG
jgi:uncharacterized membrane protein